MVKYQLEYPTKSSIKILYNCLSSPSGLSEWFADDINLKDNGKVYIFQWDGSEQEAELLNKKENHYIRFRWVDEDPESYFEFRIVVDEMTGDATLVITDFADDDDEAQEQQMLWDSQVKELFHTLGS